MPRRWPSRQGTSTRSGAPGRTVVVTAVSNTTPTGSTCRRRIALPSVDFPRLASPTSSTRRRQQQGATPTGCGLRVIVPVRHRDLPVVRKTRRRSLPGSPAGRAVRSWNHLARRAIRETCRRVRHTRCHAGRRIRPGPRTSHPARAGAHHLARCGAVRSTISQRLSLLHGGFSAVAAADYCQVGPLVRLAPG